MPMLGQAAMLLSFDIDGPAIEEHDRWHTHEHLPERLSISGFLRGTRWTAAAGVSPRYMVVYEVEGLQTLSSAAYLDRLNNPTPWTTRMMPSYRGMVRGLCTILGSSGSGHGGAAALVRFKTDAARSDDVHRWLLDEVLPEAARRAGIGAAHLLQGTQAAVMTNEQRLRGADRSHDSALILSGYDESAVTRLADDLCAPDALPRRGAGDLSRTIYRLGYALSAQDAARLGA